MPACCAALLHACRTLQAAALVAAELCLLGDEYTQLSALRLVSVLCQYLQQAALGVAQHRGLGVHAAFSQDSPNWYEGPNPLVVPVLQRLANPVLEGLVSDVVPVLLPTCHVGPLPSDLPVYEGTMAATLPQQLFVLSVQGGEGNMGGGGEQATACIGRLADNLVGQWVGG